MVVFLVDIMIKPDGVQRGLVGKVIGRFEAKGAKLAGLKLVTPTKKLLEQHYVDLKSKPFFPSLIKYMESGPVVAMVWEGQDVVKTGRALLGPTDPRDGQPGTIRGDWAMDVGRNVCHGSDSVQSAEREIALWFSAPQGGGDDDRGLHTYQLDSTKWVWE